MLSLNFISPSSCLSKRVLARRVWLLTFLTIAQFGSPVLAVDFITLDASPCLRVYLAKLIANGFKFCKLGSPLLVLDSINPRSSLFTMELVRHSSLPSVFISLRFGLTQVAMDFVSLCSSL